MRIICTILFVLDWSFEALGNIERGSERLILPIFQELLHLRPVYDIDDYMTSGMEGALHHTLAAPSVHFHSPHNSVAHLVHGLLHFVLRPLVGDLA